MSLYNNSLALALIDTFPDMKFNFQQKGMHFRMGSHRPNSPFLLEKQGEVAKVKQYDYIQLATYKQELYSNRAVGRRMWEKQIHK